MSSFPQDSPHEAHAPLEGASPKRTNGAAELWIWLVIVALVAAVVYRTTSSGPVKTDEMVVRNAMAKFRAESVVGLQSLRLTTGQQPIASVDVADRLIRSFERDAHTPEDQLYVA